MARTEQIRSKKDSRPRLRVSSWCSDNLKYLVYIKKIKNHMQTVECLNVAVQRLTKVGVFLV
jgi:hypothetical protein